MPTPSLTSTKWTRRAGRRSRLGRESLEEGRSESPDEGRSESPEEGRPYPGLIGPSHRPAVRPCRHDPARLVDHQLRVDRRHLVRDGGPVGPPDLELLDPRGRAEAEVRRAGRTGTSRCGRSPRRRAAARRPRSGRRPSRWRPWGSVAPGRRRGAASASGPRGWHRRCAAGPAPRRSGSPPRRRRRRCRGPGRGAAQASGHREAFTPAAAHLGEAALQVPEEQRPLRRRRCPVEGVHPGVDVAVGHEEVRPAVVVVVRKFVPQPTNGTLALPTPAG